MYDLDTRMLGKYIIMGAVSCTLTLFAKIWRSDYITFFIINEIFNMITFVVFVFSANLIAFCVLINRIEILKQKTGESFSRTIIEIRKSVNESIIFLFIVIFGTITMLVLEYCIYSIPLIKEINFSIIIFSIMAMIAIVFDTLNAIIMCLHHSMSEKELS